MYVPIIQFLLCQYSKTVVDFISESSFDLNQANDFNFIKVVF